MHSTADGIKSAAPRDSVIAICLNVLTFRAEFLTQPHQQLPRRGLWLGQNLSVITLGGPNRRIRAAFMGSPQSSPLDVLDLQICVALPNSSLMAALSSEQDSASKIRNDSRLIPVFLPLCK